MAVTNLRRVMFVLSVVMVTLAVSQIGEAIPVRAQDYSAILAAPDRSVARARRQSLPPPPPRFSSGHQLFW